MPDQLTNHLRPVKDIAAEAAAILRKYGWTQGTLLDEDEGSSCVLGAALRAVGLRPDSYTTIYREWSPLQGFIHALVDTLGAETDDPTTADHFELVEEILAWNDESSRTVEDVLEVLDQMAS